MIIEDIKQMLTESGIEFKHLKLKYSPKNTLDIADQLNCNISQVIKTLFWIGDARVLVCLPGDEEISIKKLKKHLGVSRLRLANRQEVLENIGVEIGAVTPLNKRDFKVLIEKKILTAKKINIGIGSSVDGIEISPNDLVKITNSVTCDIT